MSLFGTFFSLQNYAVVSQQTCTIVIVIQQLMFCEKNESARITLNQNNNNHNKKPTVIRVCFFLLKNEFMVLYNHRRILAIMRTGPTIWLERDNYVVCSEMCLRWRALQDVCRCLEHVFTLVQCGAFLWRQPIAFERSDVFHRGSQVASTLLHRPSSTEFTALWTPALPIFSCI